MEWNIRRLTPKIFLVEFEDAYDMAMTCLRCQEYYESDNLDFYRKSFDILDYIEWYAKQHGNKFSYPDDFIGYNFPLNTYWNLMRDDESKFIISNKYDRELHSIYRGIVEMLECGSLADSCYLIACLKGDAESMKHEIAHGLYCTDKEYRCDMDELLRGQSGESWNGLMDFLDEKKYHETVFMDEAQAYIASQNLDNPDKNDKYSPEEAKPFVDVLNKYMQEVNI